MSSSVHRPLVTFTGCFNIFIYVLGIVAIRLEKSESSKNLTSTSREMKATGKSYYNGLFRRFALPPGTFLIFEPELTLPAWRDYVRETPYSRKGRKDKDYTLCDMDGKGSSFAREDLDGDGDEDIAAFKNAAIQISSPFYVYFDKLGWTHESSIYNAPQQVASYIQEYLINPTLHIFGVPPPSKVVAKNAGNAKSEASFLSPYHSSSKKGPPLSEVHRLQVFQKVETLLEEIGAENGRACLLRAICELHEFPFDTGRFGIFGEVLALILSATPGTYEDRRKVPLESKSQCMNMYARAEKYGKAKECTMYTKYCQFSIFHWYWKMAKT